MTVVWILLHQRSLDQKNDTDVSLLSEGSNLPPEHSRGCSGRWGELVPFSSLREGRTGTGAGCAPRGWGPHAANPEGPQHPRGRPGRPAPPLPREPPQGPRRRRAAALCGSVKIFVARTPDPAGASGRSGERGLSGAWGGDRREAQGPPSPRARVSGSDQGCEGRAGPGERFPLSA